MNARQRIRANAWLLLCVAWPAAAQMSEAATQECARSFKSAAPSIDPSTEKILLLGDSTVAGSTPRHVEPDGDHLEKLMASGLAAQPGVPALRVVNLGVGGDYVRRFLTSGRYDRMVARQTDVRFVLMRFGLNDYFHLPDFANDFPSDYAQLIQRLRTDHPRATLLLMLVIPYHDSAVTSAINRGIRLISQAQGLPLLDTHTPYVAALREAPNGLNYRSLPLAAVPEVALPALAQHVYRIGGVPQVVVLDDALDQRFGRLPRWFADRHPNFAGYKVIADTSVGALVACIRAAGR